jgi:hypothetical protein
LGTGDGIELLKILDYTDVEKELNLPAGYNLSQNYPNPFNPTTKISYSIPTDSRVVIKIYDAAGREVETIENNERTAGTYTVTFDAKQLSSGVYYYKLTTNNYTAAKKFVLIK